MSEDKMGGALVFAIRELGEEPGSYSGRCMYGKKCVSVNVNDLGFLLNLGIHLGQENPELDHLFSDLEVRSDQMGLGSVIYFPEVEWKPEYADDSFSYSKEDDGEGDGDTDEDE